MWEQAWIVEVVEHIFCCLVSVCVTWLMRMECQVLEGSLVSEDGKGICRG
jgi:hypothetical protein